MTNYKRYFIAAVAAACTVVLQVGADPLDVLFPHKWIGNIDKAKFTEPSGIVYHPLRQTLFVVSDEGFILEMGTDGEVVKQDKIRQADFEGVTCDPSSGLLYLAVEGEEKIVEVDPDDFAVLREFVITRSFDGHEVLKEGGQGIEGITFVPDADHAHGGTFYVANQAFDPAAKEDVSGVFEIEVPLRGKDTKATITRFFTFGATDLSGLHYDEARQRLYLVSDSANAFFEVSMQGELLRAYAFTGQSQEGITLDDEGYVYVAQDAGGVIKIKWLRSAE